MNSLKVCVLCANVLEKNAQKYDFKSDQLNEIINSIYKINCNQYNEAIFSICESCVKSAVSISTHIKCVSENQKQVKSSSLLLCQLFKKPDEEAIEALAINSESKDIQVQSYSSVVKIATTQPLKLLSTGDLNEKNETTMSTDDLNDDNSSTDSGSSPKKKKQDFAALKSTRSTYKSGETVNYFDYSTGKISKATIFDVLKNNTYRIVVGKESLRRHGKYLSKFNDKKENKKHKK